MFFYLLKTKLRYPLKVIKRKEWTKILVVFLFTFLASGMVFGVYTLFQRWFDFLQTQNYFGSALTFYVLEVFFLVVSLLLFFSSVIATIVFLFHSKELQFLFTVPFKNEFIFRFRLLLSFISSFWPLAILGVPALLALSFNFHIGVLGFISYLIGLLVFGFVVVASGAAAGLVWKKFLSHRCFVFRAVLIVVVLVVILAGSYFTIFPKDFQNYFSIGNLGESIISAREIMGRFRFWPASHFLVQYFLSFTEGNALLWFLNLSLLGGLAALVLFWLQKSYYRVWLRDQEKNFVAGREAKPARNSSFWSFSSFWFLVEKEARLFKRRFNEISRALFLFLLLLFYITAISYLSSQLSLTRIQRFRPILSSLNLAILGYFTITISLRYVFPSFSREKGSINFLLSSSPNRARIFMAKYLFWLAVVGVPIFLLNAFSFIAMGYGGKILASVLFYSCLLVATFVFLALELGAYFADFKVESADQYTTTPAGLALTISGLAYVFLGAYIFQKILTGLSFTYFGVYILATFAALGGMLVILPKSLEKLGR